MMYLRRAAQRNEREKNTTTGTGGILVGRQQLTCASSLTAYQLAMRRYSPAYYSPPRRGYGGRERSPPPRGYGGGGGGGGHGRRKDQNRGSLLVRNIPLDCRADELRVAFERFGAVRDVYIPKDYYSGEPRGFAFIQFLDPYDALEAQHRMNKQIFAGREISVVLAAETRKRPEEMRHKYKQRGSGGHGGRSSHYGHSRSRSISRSRSPHDHPSPRSRYRSRSYSPAPRQKEYSSPGRRYTGPPKSPRGPPAERDGGYNRRSYSPRYEKVDNMRENANGYDQKSTYAFKEERGFDGRASRSPSGSRCRPAEISPRR